MIKGIEWFNRETKRWQWYVGIYSDSEPYTFGRVCAEFPMERFRITPDPNRSYAPKYESRYRGQH